MDDNQNGIDRVDQIKDDDCFLREILPEEVWEQVLNEVIVDSPEDLINVSNSSSYFRRLLDSHKAQYLFPEVLHILLTEGYLVPKKVEGIDHQNIPFLEEELPGGHSPSNNGDSTLDKGVRKVLKLRLISKTWKHSVDSFYEKKLYHGRARDVPYGEAFTQTFAPMLYPPYDDKTTIFAFLTHFNKSHGRGDSTGNPFLSRGCYFNCKMGIAQKQPREFLNNVSSLLRKYGHHLHKCTLDFTVDNDIKSYHSKLTEWFALLPKLKMLEILARNHPFLHRHQMTQMELACKSVPFPKITTIDSLVLDNVKYPFNAYILEACSQLSHLSLNNYPFWHEPPYPFTLTQVLPNLTHLKMIVYHQRDFEALEASQFSPAFISLELVFYFVPYRSRKLLRVLGRIWEGSLTSLSLLIVRKKKNEKSEARGKNYCRNCSRYRMMYLPHVTTFKVEVKFLARRFSFGPSFDDIDGIV